MNHASRLSHAKSTGWVANYTGKNIIKGYSKWFAVDLLAAITELRLLGVQIESESEESIKAAIATRAESRRRQREASARKKAGDEERWIKSDDTFACIVGYTSGGAPYGITWEETKILEAGGDPFSSPLSFDDLDDPDNLPF